METGLKPKKISSEKVVVTSFLLNISDIVVNLFVAVISGSIVMVTQALEGAADLLASSFLVVGVRRAKKPSDRKHPYGYGRELYFWTFLSALATFSITAGASFYLGLKRFLDPEPVSHLAFAYLALVVAVFTNGYSASLSLRRLVGGRPVGKIWSAFFHSALIETKTTFVLDLMGTLASVLGLVALLIYGVSGDARFDGIGAMAIGVTLAILALFIVKSARDLLLGQSASPEVEEKIKKAASLFEHVKQILDLRTLQIGPERVLVNMEVNLTDRLTTDEIELLIDKIEREIKKQVPSAVSIQIELETPDV